MAPRKFIRLRRTRAPFHEAARFLDHVQGHDDVWICQRQAVARHWIARHPYAGRAATAGE